MWSLLSLLDEYCVYQNWGPVTALSVLCFLHKVIHWADGCQLPALCWACSGKYSGRHDRIKSLYGGSVIVEEWRQTNKWARTSNSNKCNKESIIFSCDRITWLDQEDARYGGWRWPLHGIAVSGKSLMMTESRLLRYRGDWRR